MGSIRVGVVGLVMIAGVGGARGGPLESDPDPQDSVLARQILADEETGEVQGRAKTLLATGLTACSSS